jgi:hypothetical protein
MADIVIRGVEMPETNFSYINLQIWGNGGVYKLDRQCNLTPVKYQVVPLPEGHGRPIDANELELDLVRHNGAIGFELIGNAPTIVPAEGGTDE